MKATEKNLQSLSMANFSQPNAKYNNSKRWRAKPNDIQDYIEYMKTNADYMKA